MSKHIIKLSESGLNAEFHFPYDYEEKEYVKNTLRARYVPDDPKHWIVPIGYITYEEITNYAHKFYAQIDPELRDVYLGHQTNGMPTQELDDDISMLPMGDFKIELYPFQRAGVKYAWEKQRILNADDMGLGKTYQSLASVVALGAHRNFIVVCPASVKVNWAREVVKAIKDIDVCIWDAKHRGEANCIIINYDNLEKQLPYLKMLYADAIIIDEIHYAKNGKAKRTKAVMELARDIPVVLGLTGTPVINRPVELVSILQILGCFTQFGSWFDFVYRYCEAHKKPIWVKPKNGGRAFQKEILDTSGASNLTELHMKLRASCMVRRKKVEVLDDLPNKVRVQQVFEIDNRDEYMDAQDNFLSYIEACAAEDKAFLATIAHLPLHIKEEKILEHQIEEGQKAERAQQLVMIETLKKIATRGKLDAVVQWVTDFLDTGEKLVVFATHIFAQEYLLKKFKGSAHLMGEDDAYVRQDNIDRFRNDPNCNLLVASLKAGGTGVDGLQEVCSNAAFLEMGWTPAEHMQAEDRIYRIGQNEHVTIYYLVAEDTIEEEIQQMLAQKQAVCEAILDGAPDKVQGSVFDELLAVMKQRKATKGRLFT